MDGDGDGDGDGNGNGDGDRDGLAERFERQRGQLRAVAYRMLGSLSEADDALQEAWLRADRADASAVDNLGGWFTTIVARVCLNKLRSRSVRGEDELDVRLPDPIIDHDQADDPEHDVLLEDAVGFALLVVLDTLSPAERLAFVLHDLFAVPFEPIASILDRSPAAARQLASRARRRVQGARTTPDADLARQRAVVDAFFAAARDGDFDTLLAVLDPDVVVRADAGTGAIEVLRGAATVAAQAITYRESAAFVHTVLVNGAVGALVVPDSRLTSVMAFTVADGRVVAIDALADPAHLARVDLSPLAP